MKRQDAFERDLGLDTPASQIMIRAATLLVAVVLNAVLFTGMWSPDRDVLYVAAPIGLAVAAYRLVAAVRAHRTETSG